jgi:iron complex transport system permease protein
MKVVLDLTRLRREGKITAEEFERLRRLAAEETGSLAINILTGLGVVAVSSGLLALLMNELAVAGIGIVLLGAGLVLSYVRQWQVLATICVLVGALMLAGGIVALRQGDLASLLIATAVLAGAAIAGRSSLLMGLAVLSLAACIGASTGYRHAFYELTIAEPTVTILVFGALAFVAYRASLGLGEYEPLALTASRVSLFLVNFGFWVGSFWGDRLPLVRTLVDRNSGGLAGDSAGAIVVPEIAFVIGWAVALLAVGAWAVAAGRRWVVNLVAVFAAIHFYTQWFERLGATPLSVVGGGLLLLIFAAAARMLNQRLGDAAELRQKETQTRAVAMPP